MTCKKTLVWAVSILWIISLFACAGTQAKRNKQAQVTRSLGEAYMQQGNITEALREFLKAEKLNPKDHLLHNDLGLVYMAKERLEKAEFHFKKAIDLRAEYAPAKNNLGTVYLAKKDWDAAIAQFQTVAGDILYATPHYPLTNMGFAYYNKKDYASAEKYYQEALDLRPEFGLALRGLGKTYMALNKLPEAISTLEKAMKAAPQSADSQMDLANAYHMQGQTQKALFAYRRVTTLAPNSPLAETAKREIIKIQNQQ